MNAKRVGGPTSSGMSRRTPTGEACENEARHTLQPTRYVEWHEWAENKSKTHVSTSCPSCGKYMIWKPKPGGTS